MINSFKNASVYSIYSHSYILDSEGSQMRCPSITIAPTPSATAIAAAKKRLQNIHEQELKDRKQERAYKVALN